MPDPNIIFTEHIPMFEDQTEDTIFVHVVVPEWGQVVCAKMFQLGMGWEEDCPCSQ